jgi:hypothetical protein
MRGSISAFFELLEGIGLTLEFQRYRLGASTAQRNVE